MTGPRGAERGMCFGGKLMWPRSIIYSNLLHQGIRFNYKEGGPWVNRVGTCRSSPGRISAASTDVTVTRPSPSLATPPPRLRVPIIVQAGGVDTGRTM